MFYSNFSIVVKVNVSSLDLKLFVCNPSSELVLSNLYRLSNPLNGHAVLGAVTSAGELKICFLKEKACQIEF